MTREQYLLLLRAELTGNLPREELEDILRYYTEYFEDAGPEREREVMTELGSPQRLAERILGRSVEESMAPGLEGYTSGVQEAEYAPPAGSRIPGWAFVLLLIGAVIFAGPLFLGLVLGFGIGGLVCFVVGAGLLISGIGTFSFAGLLYQGGGGLIAIAVGLLLLTAALWLVWRVVKLVDWFYHGFVEGGDGYEADA